MRIASYNKEKKSFELIKTCFHNVFNISIKKKHSNRDCIELSLDTNAVPWSLGDI